MSQLGSQVAIISKKQYTSCVTVEAAYRINTFLASILHQIHNFESLGYHVTKLDRVYFAGLTKRNLGRGKWRYLNEREVNALRMGAFE